jgi:methionine sulfoxide reductase heme-binding subunit
MSDQILWFITRGAGVVALLLSSGVVCLGLLTVTRFSRPGWPRFLTVEVHRMVSLVTLVFLAIHILTAVFDPFTNLGLVAAVVPLASSYRPLAVALGVVSLDLTLAIVISSLLRDRIAHRLWRAIHWAAYASWPLALWHGLTAGTDGFAPWMLAVDAVCVLAVVIALVWRWAVAPTLRPSLDAVVAGRDDR